VLTIERGPRALNAAPRDGRPAQHAWRALARIPKVGPAHRDLGALRSKMTTSRRTTKALQAARAYLTVIARNPQAVLKALEPRKA